MFLGLPYPDLSLFVRIWILSSTRKKVRKTLISSICITFWLLFLKTDVNAPSKSPVISKVTLKKIFFLLASCQPLTKKPGSGSRSVSNVTAPRHWRAPNSWSGGHEVALPMWTGSAHKLKGVKRSGLSTLLNFGVVSYPQHKVVY
jgi:hypothetical protein